MRFQFQLYTCKIFKLKITRIRLNESTRKYITSNRFLASDYQLQFKPHLGIEEGKVAKVYCTLTGKSMKQ